MITCSNCNQIVCICNSGSVVTTSNIASSAFTASNFYGSNQVLIELDQKQIDDIADRVADIVCEKVIDRLVERILLVEKGNDED